MNGKSDFTWSALVHLGVRMWGDKNQDDRLHFSEERYRRVTARMAEIGMNQLVIDIGEGIRLPSHPELAVKGSWSPEKVREEIARLRAMGIEAIPKLNFSTTHHFWLGEYARMVSTATYYRVCEDVIGDVSEIFGRPRFFHLGQDEEAIGEQPASLVECAVARQGELWWHDFLRLADQVSQRGSRPWIWGDVFWHHPEEAPKRVPKDVLVSNWHYGRVFDEEGPFERAYEKPRLRAYRQIDRAGFDQVPCATNWVPPYYDTKTNDVNFPGTVKFCRRHVDPKRLKGFLMAPWAHLETDDDLAFWNRALDLVAQSKRDFENGL